MEKLSVGDYVRIKNGCYYTSKIAKVTSMDYKNKLYHLDVFKSDNEMIEEKDITKHSKDIIDLIEKNDIILVDNIKYTIITFLKNGNDDIVLKGICKDGKYLTFGEFKIQSILTNQQFEANAYVLETER